MKWSGLLNLMLLAALLLLAAVHESDARGGRRGGSFGGIFGGWRKYKKPASSSNSRRVTNGSPTHNTGAKAASSNSGSSDAGAFSPPLKDTKQHKTHANYPRQQMHSGVSHADYHSYYSGRGAATLPPGGAYYANTATLPAGAVYYAQQPIRSASGTDFLFGMMTGHVLSQGLFGHRHHVTHVYKQSPQATPSDGNRVIVINNGTGNDTDASANATDVTNFWPTDGDQLASFNATHTPQELLKPVTPDPQQEMPQPEKEQLTSLQPGGGIICVPLLFNETDPNDATKTQLVDRMVCYPAPPPPPPVSPSPLPSQEAAEAAEAASSSESTHCITRTVMEPDPDDPTKAIEVQQRQCVSEALATAAHEAHPAEVAGDIVEGGSADAVMLQQTQ